MARHLNADWSLPDICQTWEQVQVAVLMDIRRELVKLNGVLACPRFLGIPDALDAIRRNTVKRKKKPKVKVKLAS